MNITFDAPSAAEIYEAVKKTMQKDEAADLMAEIIEKAAGAKNWNEMDRLTWLVSEAYCSGFVQGALIAFQACEDQAREAQQA